MLGSQDEFPPEQAEEIHWDHHAHGFHIRNEDRRLEYPVCSGLPLWEWEYTRYTEGGKREFMDGLEWTHNIGSNRSWVDGDYCILFEAFNWRKPRVWRWFKCPQVLCSKCGKWGERWDKREPAEVYHLHEWFRSGLCVKCAEQEIEEFNRLPVEQQAKQLIILAAEAAKRRKK